MRKVTDTVRKASADAAASMTAKIRSSAISSGWDPEVASKVSLVHNGKNFSVQVDPAFKDRVLDHEFGTETTPPKPVLRQHLLHPRELNQHIGRAFNKRWSNR